MSGEKEAQINSDRREHILQIAMKRFAKDGYHATKISDIVAEAGWLKGRSTGTSKAKKRLRWKL